MLRRRTAQGAAAAALLTGLLTLSACTGPDPSTTDPHTTRSTGARSHPTPSTTPTTDLSIPPERPAAMEQPSPTGAAAAATYFMGLYEYAYTTGDTTDFQQMSDQDCDFCRSVLDDIRQSRAASSTEEGGGSTVTSAVGTEISPNEWYSATLRITQHASTRRDANGNVLVQDPEAEHDLYFALSWVDDWWRVDDVDVLAPGTLTTP